MQLTPGTRIGSYEVVAPLGAGAMGEVYRAHDTRLGRDVAIKVLPDAVARHPDRLARFEREAKILASINHPNVAAIYGVEGAGEARAIVLELIEGPTLAELIAEGPLPVVSARRIVREVAEGLRAAHARGVIHRDLKPANIKIAADGRVKVLDFGLARALRTPDLTREGTTVGTVGYFSPEQSRGETTDHRTDIWALGAIWYELLTGARAFPGDYDAAVVYRIVSEDPAPVETLRPETPAETARLIGSMLAKSPANRPRDVDELIQRIEVLTDEPSGERAPKAPVKRPGRWHLAGWGLAALATAAAITLALRSGGADSTPASFTAVTYHPMAIFKASFGPDGETILFSGAPEGNTPSVFVIRPEYPEPKAVSDPGTHLLAVSSRGELAVLTDAHYVAQRLFNGTLARMPLGGGAPRAILENVREADWVPDGTQLAIIREVDGKDRVEYPIGTVLYESGGYLSDICFSPRGDLIAFCEHPWRWDNVGTVNVVDLHGRKTTLSGGEGGKECIAWTPDASEILFSTTPSGTAWAVHAVTPSGKQRVVLSSAGGLTIHDVSPRGRWLTSRDDQPMRVMVHTPAWPGDRDLSWLDLSLFPVLSRDGRTLVFCEQSSATGSNYAVCLRRTEGGDVVRLGEGVPLDMTADGSRVLAGVNTPPHLVIYPTGAGEPLRLDHGGLESVGGSGQWFPDGKRIIFLGNEPGKAPRYFVQDLAGGAPRAATPEGSGEGVLLRDGESVLARGPEGGFHVYPLSGGEPRAVPWLAAQDRLVRVSADGRSVLVCRIKEIPARVERVDLMSGRRDFVMEITPEDRVGLRHIWLSSMSDDERSYAYWTWWLRSTLYTVDWER